MANERCLECELSWAAGDGNLAAVRELLVEGADPGSDTDCNTALFDAIHSASVEIVAELLNAGVDPLRREPITDKTPLMAALEGEHVDVIRELTRRGVDPASASFASLVRGVDRPEIVHLALSAGVDINSADPKTGKTALHEAATYGYLRTVKCLIEEGADTSVRDNWGNTSATIAIRNHHHKVARLLAEVTDEPK